MRIILCAFDVSLEDAWKSALPDFAAMAAGGGHSLEARRGDITHLCVTAVVSPANSYGYMRGGVDLAYTRHFGEGVERALREKIAALPEGFLPIGHALAVATGDAGIPYLVSAPTMKTPRRLDGPETVVAASRAAIACALHEGYDSLAFPGMGTGTGGLDAAVAARGMLQGITEGLRRF